MSMSSRHRFIEFIQSEYYGKILTGKYSTPLKKRVAELISHFKAVDNLDTQAIPYISAWSDKNPHIWYEFASHRLTSLLNCPANQVAKNFSQKIIDRSIYKTPSLYSTITKEIINREELHLTRQKIRRDVLDQRAVEAIYKLAINGQKFIWLKDQASIEVYPEDKIYLSPGFLFVITKEMQVENELKKAKEELKKHQYHLEDLVAERTIEVWRTQLEMVYRLSKAVEFRDKDTGNHITTMSHYCAIICKAIGVERKAAKLLFHATPMHDVGKIGISDKILFKPGKLNHKEFSLMKTHSNIGAKLLSGNNSNLLRIAQSVALTHHERWDGKGYPGGLVKKEIPLAGRIVAICDVFDALTSERPYKTAWSFERAISELHKGKGTHFDPHLVNVFIRNIPKIKKVYLQHRRPASSHRQCSSIASA